MPWTLQGLGHLRITLTLLEDIFGPFCVRMNLRNYSLVNLVEFTFVFTDIKSVGPELLEYFLDVLPVIFHVIRVDKDIIQID